MVPPILRADLPVLVYSLWCITHVLGIFQSSEVDNNQN
jgi:hypothetical protein